MFATPLKNSMAVKDLKNSGIIVATHFFATGPAQNLEEYLVNQKIKKLLTISHPLLYEEKDMFSEYRIYETGVLISEKQTPRKKKYFVSLNYFYDILATIFKILVVKEKWDLFVGSGNLNAFCGILLKTLRKVEKVVYYSIDFVPHRFNNLILNAIYRFVEKFCTKYSDEIWNLSPRMAEGREKYLGLLETKYGFKQKLVPEGVWFDRIKRHSPKNIKRHNLVYIGHLVPRMGVQKVIEAIPEIVKKISDFKFIIIGKGDYKDTLIKLAEDLKVSKYIEFAGFIKDHINAENLISNCAVGAAVYDLNDKKSFSYYADPGKIKIYLAAGLPVIMTNLFYNAKEIESEKAGIIVDYDKKSIAEAIIALMQNEEKWLECRQAAIKYMKKLDWNNIFTITLNKTLC